eukprot:3949319-Pleurochrysis_carterae.AAC.1
MSKSNREIFTKANQVFKSSCVRETMRRHPQSQPYLQRRDPLIKDHGFSGVPGSKDRCRLANFACSAAKMVHGNAAAP